jgi:hypothetical protein
MTPPPDTELLAPASQAIAAVKPIYWVIVTLVTLGWGAAQFAKRVETIEADVATIKLILCADASAAADTYCRKGAR